MKIFTSYYAKFRELNPYVVCVQISTSKPSWFTYAKESIPELFPGWDLVNGIKSGNITELEYESIYKDRLKGIDKEHILSVIEEISKRNGGKDVALLCYEKPGDFCHRHFVGEWLGIEEYNHDDYIQSVIDSLGRK